MAWAPDYVVLEDAKRWVRLAVTDELDDAEIALIISAASRGIDDHCNRQFGKTAGAEERLYTAWYDDERERWIVDTDDFQSASGLTISVDGVAATEYTKEPVNAPQEGKPWEAITFKRTAPVAVTGLEFEVSVTANPFGWTAFPAQVPLGTRLQINRFLARRDAAFGIAGSPESQLRLLSQLDPDVAVSLRGLRRPRKVG